MDASDIANGKSLTDHFDDHFEHAKLTRQLALLQDVCKGSDIKTVHDLVDMLSHDASGMTSNLLDEVSKLMSNRLLLVLPSSSCSVALLNARLYDVFKLTRTTMTAERLNSITLLHSHKEEMDGIDLNDVLR